MTKPIDLLTNFVPQASATFKRDTVSIYHGCFLCSVPFSPDLVKNIFSDSFVSAKLYKGGHNKLHVFEGLHKDNEGLFFSYDTSHI